MPTPAAPQMATHRHRGELVDFYEAHNPDKLDQVDAILDKYEGREEELMKTLRDKYGVAEQGGEEDGDEAREEF